MGTCESRSYPRSNAEQEERYLSVTLLEEPDALLLAMSRHAIAKYFPIEQAQRRDQGGSAVTWVVVIEGSSLVRDKIWTGLTKSGRFPVAESPQHADAVLAGLAGYEKWYHGMEWLYEMEGNLDSHYPGVGHFRLMDSNTKQTIWMHEYKRGFLNPKQSVAERIAIQVVDKFLTDTMRVDGLPHRTSPSPLP